MTFTGRFRHRMRFSMRVWPRDIGAANRSLRQKEIPVSGMWLNKYGKMEVVYRYGNIPTQFHAFELSDADADKLTEVGAAGAVLGKMVIHCPGTRDGSVKKECRLEVNVTVYPDAPDGKTYHNGLYNFIDCKPEEIPAELTKVWGVLYGFAVRHEERFWGKKRRAARVAAVQPYEYKGHVILDNPQLLDIDTLARQIMMGKAILLSDTAFTGKMADIVRERLEYYTVPGRKPDEEGGLFHGYQLGGYVFRYHRAVERDAQHLARHMEKMHESVRNGGQVRRRDIFIRAVIDRIATKYGLSEQRVMLRFIQGGILDYLIRSYEAAASDGRLYIHGIPEHDMRAFINYAVNIVSFIVEGLTDEEAA